MANTDLTYGFNLSLLISNINPVWKSKVQMVQRKVSLFTSALLDATWFSSPEAISFTNGSLLKAENRERKEEWREVRKEGRIENASMLFDRYYFLEPLIWSVSMVASVASNKVGPHFKQFFVKWTKCQKVSTTMGGKMPTISGSKPAGQNTLSMLELLATVLGDGTI